ncbi:MAG: hypothetical protein V4735_09545 [Pseudomonadota bacterium]
MEFTTIGLIGLAAPVLFLFAYAMISIGRWNAEMLRFQVLNFLGAIAILISLTEQWNLPVFILEICWGAISVYGIVKLLRKRGMMTKRFMKRALLVLVILVGALIVASVSGKGFNRSGWDAADISGHEPTKRCSMANDLIRNHLIIGSTTKQQALALIGPADAPLITQKCANSLTYDLGFCSLMDGHTLDLCFDDKDILTSAQNLQH